MWLYEGLQLASLGSLPSHGPGEFWGRVGPGYLLPLLQGGRVPVVQGSRTGSAAGSQNRFSGASRWPGPIQVWQGPVPHPQVCPGYFSPSLLSPQMAFSHW